MSRRIFGVAAALVAAAWNSGASAQLVELPQIVITAPGPLPAQAELQPGGGVIVGDTFAPVTVTTGDAIQRSPASNIADVLFTLPGITSTTFAPGASRPVIRGLDNYRVRLQEGGLATGDVSALGEDHAVPLDPLVADQIEVVRGPATLRWGSQAIGGVVQVTNNRIPEILRAPGIYSTFKGAFTSVDNGLEGAVLVDAYTKNFAFHADAFQRSADDYRIPGGRQPNTALRAAGGALGGTWFFDQGHMGFSVSHYASLYRVPGEEATEHNIRLDVDQIRFAGKGEYRPDAAAIEAIRYWIGVTRYKHDELGMEGGMPDGVLSTFHNREQEARVEIQHAPLATMLGALKGVLGAHFMNQRLSAEGEASELLAPAHTQRLAAFVFEELKLGDTLRLQAAGRIERVHVRGTAATFPPGFLPPPDEPAEFAAVSRFTPMSAGVGLLKDLPWGLIASVTAQYVERAPEAPELFSKGPHHATETFEIGNPNLTKEAARTVELGLKRPRGDFRFEANAYHTRYAGFIFKRLTGIRCGEDFASCGMPGADELTQVVYSQRDATFYGAEIVGQLDLVDLVGGTLGVDGRYDFVRARFADGTNVPRIPPQRVGGGVYWYSADWFVRVGLLHAFAQTAIAANETPTPGYNLLKAEIAYRKRFVEPGVGPREVVVGIVGDNLLNDDVRNHVAFNKNEVLLPGRTVRVFARTMF
jgi:iron complex outermembrane receptor protein